MSSHADTIRRQLPEFDSEIDVVREAHEALDALLAENEEWRVLAQRQLEEFTVTTQEYRAENQRLREENERLEAILYPPELKLSRAQRRALRHGEGLHSQLDHGTGQHG